MIENPQFFLDCKSDFENRYGESPNPNSQLNEN